ncbi:MAG: hypothetical protein JOZ22_26985 [Acidobacteriia bacterium]|nr:hypothetical protein [Terriglobia bacterium]
MSVLHAFTQTKLGVAGVRDLCVEDLAEIVRFWHESEDDFLDYLGIDRLRLGSKDDTFERFRRAIPAGDPSQQALAFAITLNSEFAGYTVLNRYTPEVNYSHWHITNPHLRGARLSTALYPHRIKTYFDRMPIRRLIHQTRTRNIAVNRMLDKFVPISETRYIQDPDGVALPGEFHLRYVLREDVAQFFEKLKMMESPHSR